MILLFMTLFSGKEDTNFDLDTLPQEYTSSPVLWASNGINQKVGTILQEIGTQNNQIQYLCP